MSEVFSLFQLNRRYRDVSFNLFKHMGRVMSRVLDADKTHMNLFCG